MTERKRARAAVLASGGGSNLQAILDHLDALGEARAADVVLVATDRADAGALARAERAGVARVTLDDHRDGDAVLRLFAQHGVDLVALAGYLRLVPNDVVRRFHGRLLNVHPALLPAFGGKGMWGRAVHEAVLRAGVDRTGVTVHFVNERYDEGDILAQWPVPVHPGDDADTLAARVLQVEHLLYPLAAQRLCRALAAGEEPTPLPAPDEGHPRLVELVQEAFSAR